MVHTHRFVLRFENEDTVDIPYTPEYSRPAIKSTLIVESIGGVPDNVLLRCGEIHQFHSTDSSTDRETFVITGGAQAGVISFPIHPLPHGMLNFNLINLDRTAYTATSAVVILQVIEEHA